MGPWPDEGERGGDDDDSIFLFRFFFVLRWICALLSTSMETPVWLWPEGTGRSLRPTSNVL